VCGVGLEYAYFPPHTCSGLPLTCVCARAPVCVQDPFAHLVRARQRTATAQIKNAARFDPEDVGEVPLDDDGTLSMKAQPGGYGSAVKGVCVCLVCAPAAVLQRLRGRPFVPCGV
jgi:hypothetical protein